MLERPLNRLSLAGLSATLIGNGIGRFAFIALMPALIQAGWFTKGEASYLSVATLVGYGIGAWMSDYLGTRFSTTTLLRGSMLLCSVSFFACAIEGAGLPWYFFWRTAAGLCGAILMVLPAPIVLPLHQASIRGRVSGILFSGIGLGAVISGMLVPVLISGIGLSFLYAGELGPTLALQGITGAWVGMGGLCLFLTLFSWRHWPPEAQELAVGPGPREPAPPIPDESRRAIWLILAAHGLNAVGYLAHTLFWVDYIVRELKMPLATGGFYWALFGVGAAMGPLITGSLADAFGLKRCLVIAFMLKAMSALLPVFSSSSASLFVSSIVMGLCTPGIVALISAYTLDRAGAVHHRRAWGMATFSFAMAQAAGGFLMAMVATHLDSYLPLFCISAVALVGSTVCIALIRQKVSAANPLPAEQVSADGISPEVVVLGK